MWITLNKTNINTDNCITITKDTHESKPAIRFQFINGLDHNQTGIFYFEKFDTETKRDKALHVIKIFIGVIEI